MDWIQHDHRYLALGLELIVGVGRPKFERLFPKSEAFLARRCPGPRVHLLSPDLYFDVGIRENIAIPPWVLQAQSAGTAPVAKRELAAVAMARARKLGASYADIRINRYRNESIFTREHQVQNVARTQSFGFGVRVLFKGAWGFAASQVVTPEAVRQVTEQAVEIARAQAAYQS